ncbi:MAG: DMT family transporter [Leptolyngbya sp. SIO4C1]|nr:DMT family transporter [Leptolyngbya sp. SIO4C1]
MIDLSAFRGEIAALGAAALWAFATLLFGRLGQRLSPLILNLVKGVIAVALIAITLILRQQLLAELPRPATGLLLLSGAIGIGFGDTAYFATVNNLGPRRALLMEMLAPPLAAVIAIVALQERLSGLAWLGIGLTLAGVAWVVSERVPAVRYPAARFGRGIGFGLLAALGQSVGAVLSRAALADTSVAPLWSSLLRLLAGLLAMLLLLLRPRMRQGLAPLKSKHLLAGVAIAAFFGTYLAIWLQQTALKFAPTGIAQSLLATSPLFVLPMTLLLGERVTLRSLLGAAVALAGICLLFTR